MASDPKGLGAKFDAHTDAEFNTRDLEATMATLPHVTHVPTMTGGAGYDPVRHFYENYFVGRVPDWSVKLISRTIGESQLVDEVLISFTHDCGIPALLPGVKPTRRKVTIPFVVVVGFDKDEKGCLPAHLLGSGERARSDRPDRQGWPPGHWRGAGSVFPRSEPPIEHAHFQGLIPHQALGLRCRGARLPAVTVRGLTAAVSLWFTAALGIVYGVGFFYPAILATLAFDACRFALVRMAGSTPILRAADALLQRPHHERGRA